MNLDTLEASDAPDTSTSSEVHYYHPDHPRYKNIEVPGTTKIETYDPVMTDVYFQFFLLSLAIIVPLFFYLIRKLFKSLGWYTHRVAKMLDKLQKLFRKSIAKATSARLKKQGVKTTLNNQATEIVADTIEDTLNEKFYVEPDAPKKKEEDVYGSVEPSVPIEEDIRPPKLP